MYTNSSNAVWDAGLLKNPVVDYVWGADGDEHLREFESNSSQHLSSEALPKC